MRRTLAPLAVALALFFSWAGHAAAVALSPDVRAFSASWLTERAAALARAPFVSPPRIPLEALQHLNYDQHRDIRFRPERSMWRDAGLPFEAQFFHPGWMFRQPVRIFEVDDGKAREAVFDPGDFDYGKTSFRVPPSSGLGFAGFRLHFRLNREDYLDEVMVFLGASYFRAVARGQQYGITARGLLIDGGDGRKEEFPFFREFWLERPPVGATTMTLHALLDSPSVSGAYTFRILPGASTVMEVSATLFARKTIGKLGIAPLTSMYLFGKKDARFDDFRPEVHDSDGLSIASGNGERLWRPLINPVKGQVSVFGDENPRGYGLLQRDREFTTYEDLESRYERRPSLWVEPSEGWGKGSVYLLELHSDTEYNDNIVAYWVPNESFSAGESRRFRYRLHWSMEPPDEFDGARVVRTSSGKCTRPGARRFVVDFARGRPPAIAAGAPAEVDLKLSSGVFKNLVVDKNPVNNGYRVFFDVIPAHRGLVEIRCFLTNGKARLSETWSYRWTP
jgi:glucans biosynthesis protein